MNKFYGGDVEAFKKATLIGLMGNPNTGARGKRWEKKGKVRFYFNDLGVWFCPEKMDIFPIEPGEAVDRDAFDTAIARRL